MHKKSCDVAKAQSSGWSTTGRDTGTTRTCRGMWLGSGMHRVRLLHRMCTTRGGTTGKSPTAAGTMCPTTLPISPISTRSGTEDTTMTPKRDGIISIRGIMTRTSGDSSARTRSSVPTAVCWGTICMPIAITIPLCFRILMVSFSLQLLLLGQ